MFDDLRRSVEHIGSLDCLRMDEHVKAIGVDMTISACYTFALITKTK